METLFAHGWKVLIGLVVLVLVMVAFSSAPQPVREQAPAPPRVQPRKTLGKTTQNVLDIADARRQGGVPAEEVHETVGGLEVSTRAYRDSAGRIGTLAVTHKMKLHQAEHGSLPATYADFMRDIIAPGTPDGIHLPMLPYYQEYAYDPVSRQVVVMEFPAKKEQRRRETTGPAGL